MYVYLGIPHAVVNVLAAIALRHSFLSTFLFFIDNGQR